MLSSKHAQDVVKHELKQKKMLEERQQVFEEAFRKDIETYKSLGEIPSKYCNMNSLYFQSYSTLIVA